MYGGHSPPCLALQGLSYLVNASHQIGSKVFCPDSLASCGRRWHSFPGQAAQVMASPGEASHGSRACIVSSLAPHILLDSAEVSHERGGTASPTWVPSAYLAIWRQAIEESNATSPA